MKNPFKSVEENIDRVISGGFVPQILGLVIVIITVLTIFMFVSFCFGCTFSRGDGEGVDSLLGVVYHFFRAGNIDIYIEEDGGMFTRLFTIVIAFFGLVLLNGLLITTFSNIVQRRVDSIENGSVVYGGIRDHYVIIGYGKLTICTIDNIFKRYFPDYKVSSERRRVLKSIPKILILTGCQIDAVRSEIYSRVPRYLEKRIFLYSGNIESEEHIEHLNIDRAKEVFILGDSDSSGRDSKNLACVRMISRLRGRNRSGILQVNVQFDRTPSYSNIQKLDIPEEYITFGGDTKPNIYFRPFNFYEDWGRLLWGYYADDRYMPLDAVCETESGRRLHIGLDAATSDKHVHLVIVGFNRMGRALLLNALRICHYVNYHCDDPSTKTRITVIDKNMEALLPSFRSQYPYVEGQITDIDISFLNADIGDADSRRMIDASARNADTLLTIAVCISDPDQSLAIGLSLPESVYYLKERVAGTKDRITANCVRTQVLVRQALQNGLGELLNNDAGRYRNVRIFGTLTDGMSANLLDDTLPMMVDVSYELLQDSDSFRDKYLSGELCMPEGVTDSWVRMSENKRWSNRYQVDMFGTYKAVLAQNGICDISLCDKIDDYLLDKLADCEHRRWIAERSVSGWRQIERGESRMDVFMHHDKFVPYDMLDESEREKSRIVIRNVLVLDELLRKYCKKRR